MRILTKNNILIPLSQVAKEMSLSLPRIHKLLEFHQLTIEWIDGKKKGITEATFEILRQLPRNNGRPKSL